MKRLPLIVLAVLGLVALGFGSYLLGVRLGGGAVEAGAFPAGTRLESAPDVSGVALEQVERGPVTLGDFEGRYLVLFFGYTRCPDVCPLTLSRLATTMRDLDDPDEVQVAMITVDPETDTPAVVQRYAEGFHPDFLGLGGDQALVSEALRTFFIAARSTGEAGAAVVHSDAVLLVDREGRWRLVYGQGDTDALGADLRRILDGARL